MIVIYELRVYRPMPGRLPDLLARFRDRTIRIWDRHGIQPVGFWTTMIGTMEGEITYILAWDSLAHRETTWGAFQIDPEWQQARSESEKNGPIVAHIRSEIMKPTDFSRLK